jgi:aarF domain-containing kinase
MAAGGVAEAVSRGLGVKDASGSLFLTQSNADILAAALCRMRGAALKIGQMLSLADDTVLPPVVTAALERVRAQADVMPRAQLESVMVSQLGDGWRAMFAEFDDKPMAAASIGQVWIHSLCGVWWSVLVTPAS